VEYFAILALGSCLNQLRINYLHHSNGTLEFSDAVYVNLLDSSAAQEKVLGIMYKTWLERAQLFAKGLYRRPESVKINGFRRPDLWSCSISHSCDKIMAFTCSAFIHIAS
jgi:hypothetical protein